MMELAPTQQPSVFSVAEMGDTELMDAFLPGKITMFSMPSAEPWTSAFLAHRYDMMYSKNPEVKRARETYIQFIHAEWICKDNMVHDDDVDTERTIEEAMYLADAMYRREAVVAVALLHAVQVSKSVEKTMGADPMRLSTVMAEAMPAAMPSEDPMDTS